MNFLTSPLLLTPTVKHGFFTRKNGRSSGIYHALNCGLGSDDVPEKVKYNRQSALSAIGGASAKLCGLYQIHSNIVHYLEEPWQNDNLPKGDGLVTRQKNFALAILTADCAPILFTDPQNGVIGAAHAGWQGALTGIIENTIDMMCKYGAERQNIIAAVGPCIAQINYEVGCEFFIRFVSEAPEYEKFFTKSLNEGCYLFNLKLFTAHRLENTGIKKTDIFSKDTYADNEYFFSYRRSTHKDEKDYGRQISIIMLL